MTLEQTRAAMAFRHVQEIEKVYGAEDRERVRYGSMAQKLPILIRSAGLCQALHFVKSRPRDEKKASERTGLEVLLDHLAEQLHRVAATITDGESLCDGVRNAELSVYLWLTREALASSAWYARLAQSELKIPRGAEPKVGP